MKADIIFLRTLAKELRFLNDDEKNLAIREYRARIDERYQQGEDLKKIINSLEPPKVIAQNIYNNAGLKYESLAQSTKTNFLTLKWLGAFLSLIPQSILLIFAIVLVASGLVVGVATIPVFALVWVNFDPAQAWGVSILAVGLLPLIAIILFFIGRWFFKFEWVFVRSIWKTLTGKTTNNKEPHHSRIKLTKIFFIILVTILTGLTILGTVGTFVGDKSLGNASISGKLLHTQTEVLDFSEFTNENEEQIKVSYQDLNSISWYRFTFIQDESMESKVEINRAHNTKEDLKIDFSIEKQGEEYAIKTKMPWNLLIFNISSNKFTIKYNPWLINLKL